MAVKTTTELVVTPNPALVGQAVTLTATVSESAAGVPTGPVTFRDGAMVLGPTPLDNDRRATRTVQLNPGPHALIATYEGDPNFATSTSPAVGVTLTKAATTVELVVTPNPALVGQAVTLTATVSESAAGVPTGPVTFRDGAMVLGPTPLDNDRRATRTVQLNPGPHALIATYEGDPNFATSTSPAVGVTLTKAATTVELVVTPNPALVGQAVTLTATVSESAAGVPTGPVTFRDGAMVLGPTPLDNDRRATRTVQLNPGPHALIATYEGDPNFATSTSPAVAVAIKP